MCLENQETGKLPDTVGMVEQKQLLFVIFAKGEMNN